MFYQYRGSPKEHWSGWILQSYRAHLLRAGNVFGKEGRMEAVVTELALGGGLGAERAQSFVEDPTNARLIRRIADAFTTARDEEDLREKLANVDLWTGPGFDSLEWDLDR